MGNDAVYDLAYTDLVNGEVVENIFKSPVKFIKFFLGLDLRPYQVEVLKSCVFNSRVAVRMGRQMGKSTVIAAFCVYWCFFKKNQHIVIVSKSHNQAKLLFDKIRELVKNSHYVFSKVVKDFVTEMAFDNGSWIKALTSGQTGDTIRGHDANVIILEESAFVSDDIVDNVVRPMAGAKHDNKIIQISTPVGSNHFFNCFKENSGYTCHHFSGELADKIGHYAPGFLEEMKKSMPHKSFLQEYLAEFVEDDNTAFPWFLISKGIDESLSIPSDFQALPVPRAYHIGYDVGRYTSCAVFSVVLESAGKEFLVFYKELHRVEWDDQYNYLVNLCMYLMPRSVRIDATPGSMGGPMAERFANDKRTAHFNLIPMKFEVKSKHEMANIFIRKLESGLFKFPDDKRFIDQCLNQRARPSGGGSVKVYSPEPNSKDDILWSTLMAIWEAPEVELVTHSRAR